MAREGVFFRKHAEVHPRFHTPAFAIVAGSAWAAPLAVPGTFEQLLTYVVFSGWIFLRSRRPSSGGVAEERSRMQRISPGTPHPLTSVG